MLRELLYLPRRYGGLILDTNLLLLFVVGTYDRHFIARYRMTSSFRESDYDLTRFVAGSFSTFVVTPQVLGELTNLLRGVTRTRRGRLFRSLRSILGAFEEVFVTKDELLASPSLERVGFTDVSVLEAAARRDCLVLTEDHALAGHLRSEGRDALDLSTLRGLTGRRR